MTADELLKLPRGEFRFKLVEGELKKMSPAGRRHGKIAMTLALILGSYVKTKKLGDVFAAETGFKLQMEPDTVRAPDVSFLRKERVAHRQCLSKHKPNHALDRERHARW